MLWFCIIAYAISWTFTALVPVALVFGFVALFGPAVAAIVVVLVTGRNLGRRAAA